MLNKDIGSRLRAGALVVLVEEADELLSLACAKMAAIKLQPIKVVSCSDQNLLEHVEKHKTGEGTLILCDVLRAHGTNPILVRAIRESALQIREGNIPTSRIILLETPGVKVPDGLHGDIEHLIPKPPSVKELTVELESFLKNHDEIKLKGNGETKHALASAVAGLGRHEAARLFSRSYVERESLDQVWLRKEKAVRVSERLGGALTFVEPDAPSVGGLDALKDWLKARKKAFGSEKARQYKLNEPKGVLMLGIPGTGKSLSAKMTAQDWGVPLLRLDMGKVFGSLVGQSEAQVRLAIAAAEACSPCVLWLDEIEKAMAQGGLDGGTSQRVFAAMLTWLQEKTAPVFVMATANRINNLPPELLRKGRFDEIFFIDLPTPEERAEIVKIHLERHGRSVRGYKVAEIVAATPDFGGAEIEQAIVEGMFAGFDEEREFTTADIVKAARGTKPLSITMAEDIKALRTWADGRAKMATTQARAPQVAGSASRRVEVA